LTFLTNDRECLLVLSNMDRHVCNFRHVNKSQLLDIDENEMKRIEKREDVCFKRNGKAIL
jgi:hypothetical protein